MNKRLRLLAVPLVIVGITVIAFAGIALAADPPRTDSDGQYSCGSGWGGYHGQVATCSEEVSNLLGLTPEEICAQRLEGKSLVEIAAAQGVSEEALVEAVMSAKTEAVQARVEAGAITREQADLMLQRMEQRTREMLNRTTTGPPEWARGRGRACYGETGLGAGPGGMHRRSRGSR